MTRQDKPPTAQKGRGSTFRIFSHRLTCLIEVLSQIDLYKVLMNDTQRPTSWRPPGAKPTFTYMTWVNSRIRL